MTQGQMRRSDLEVEFLTPCFLGGAEPQQACEWRAASIRGQLRWWFRAVAGGHFRGDLPAVREAEIRVFGATSQASALRIAALGEPRTTPPSRVPWDDPKLSAENLARQWGAGGKPNPATVQRLRITGRNGQPVSSSPIQYLGYGCIGFRGLERPCVLPDPAHGVKCRFQWRERVWKSLGSEISELFELALWCWFHLGGIGAKSRNGFGSLACRGVDGDLPCGASLKLVEPSLRELEAGMTRALKIGSCAGDGLPRWSHLSPRSRIFLANDPLSTWSDAMARIGGWLIAYRRRYGFPGEMRSKDGRSLRDRDYVWASPSADGGPAFRQGLPDRAGFGLPLPFEKKDKRFGQVGVYGETVNWRPGGEDPSEPLKENRRSSPLLIHIARLGKGEYIPVLTHMSAQFLPEDAVLAFKHQPRISAPPSEAQIGAVDHFCNDLMAKNLIREVKA